MKNKITTLFVLIFLSLCLLPFGYVFIKSARDYKYFSASYNELQYEQLTFKSYRKIVKNLRNNTVIYEIHVAEYNEPFCIGVITQKELDQVALRELIIGDTIEIYYQSSNTLHYDFEIFEMKDNDNVILALSDCQLVNKSNQKAGLIASSIYITLYLIWISRTIINSIRNR